MGLHRKKSRTPYTNSLVFLIILVILNIVIWSTAIFR